MGSNKIHIGISDAALAQKIKVFCGKNNWRYCDFAKLAFDQFFEDPDNALIIKSKEELIKIIKELKSK